MLKDKQQLLDHQFADMFIQAIAAIEVLTTFMTYPHEPDGNKLPKMVLDEMNIETKARIARDVTPFIEEGKVDGQVVAICACTAVARSVTRLTNTMTEILGDEGQPGA